MSKLGYPTLRPGEDICGYRDLQEEVNSINSIIWKKKNKFTKISNFKWI